MEHDERPLEGSRARPRAEHAGEKHQSRTHHRPLSTKNPGRGVRERSQRARRTKSSTVVRSMKARAPRTTCARVDARHRGPPFAASSCNCEAAMLTSSKIGVVVFVFGAVAAIPAGRAYTI